MSLSAEERRMRIVEGIKEYSRQVQQGARTLLNLIETELLRGLLHPEDTDFISGSVLADACREMRRRLQEANALSIQTEGPCADLGQKQCVQTHGTHDLECWDTQMEGKVYKCKRCNFVTQNDKGDIAAQPRTSVSDVINELAKPLKTVYH